MSHPDPLDRYCANLRGQVPTRDRIIELRNAALIEDAPDIVARCDRMLETLFGAGQERGAAA